MSNYLVDSNTAHCSHCQGPNQWVWIFTILDEGVNCHDGHVWLALGVVHQVEVDQLFQLEVVSLHAVGHVRKQGADIFADGHRRDDLLGQMLGLLRIFRQYFEKFHHGLQQVLELIRLDKKMNWSL